MINERTINEQYTHICELLNKKRLKEALMQLESFLWQCSDWNLKSKLEQTQTTYNYLLEYMRQGANDPARKQVYQQLTADAWQIADLGRLTLLDTVSSHYYHEIRRTPHLKALAETDTRKLLHILESFEDDLALNSLLSADKAEETLRRHEETLKTLFLAGWTNRSWTLEDEVNAQAMLSSTQLLAEDLCLYLSSILLSLLECFDIKKIKWLLDVYESNHLMASKRALVNLALVTHLYQNRLTLYPELVKRMEIMSETSTFIEELSCIYQQLLLCQETEKIDKKMRDEIIPEMMKNVSYTQRFGLDDHESDEENDLNPDWEKLIEKTGLGDKLREMSDLQLEGADIYMSTFSSLKSYPFFRDIQNWFYPFTSLQTDVYKYVHTNPKQKTVLELVLNSGFFSNSDKYSFFFTTQQLPASQQDMMMGQLNEQEIMQLSDKLNGDYLKKMNEKPSILTNQYLHDLYRFFKLYSRRLEFKDIFREQFNLHHIPMFQILNRKDILFSITDFYLKKERWDEAIALCQDMDRLQQADFKDLTYYQKLGFAYQKKKLYPEAIECYNKADMLKPDTLWNIRHLATCHRLNRNYETALQHYLKVESMGQEKANIIFYIGSCYTELKEYEKALNYFFKLDFTEKDSIRAWRGIGWCSFLCGKYEQAIRYYEKAIEQKPLPIDYMNAGHAAWALNNIPQAAVYYGKSITLCGNKENFLKMFNKDIPSLLQQGIQEEDIPMVLDLLS